VPRIIAFISIAVAPPPFAIILLCPPATLLLVRLSPAITFPVTVNLEMIRHLMIYEKK
jgi:hypothetical protein